MEKNALTRLQKAVDAIYHGRGKKLKQKEIAEALGYTRQGTISEILGGKTTLTPQFIKLFSATYNVSEEWLLTGKGGEKVVFNVPTSFVGDAQQDYSLTSNSQKQQEKSTDIRGSEVFNARQLGDPDTDDGMKVT